MPESLLTHSLHPAHFDRRMQLPSASYFPNQRTNPAVEYSSTR